MQFLELVQHGGEFVQRLGHFQTGFLQPFRVELHGIGAVALNVEVRVTGQGVDLAVGGGAVGDGFGIGFDPLAQVGHDLRGDVGGQIQQHAFAHAVANQLGGVQIDAEKQIGQIAGSKHQALALIHGSGQDLIHFKVDAGISFGPDPEPLLVGILTVLFAALGRNADGQFFAVLDNGPVHIVGVVVVSGQRADGAEHQHQRQKERNQFLHGGYLLFHFFIFKRRVPSLISRVSPSPRLPSCRRRSTSAQRDRRSAAARRKPRSGRTSWPRPYRPAGRRS